MFLQLKNNTAVQDFSSDNFFDDSYSSNRSYKNGSAGLHSDTEADISNLDSQSSASPDLLENKKNDNENDKSKEEDRIIIDKILRGDKELFYVLHKKYY